MPQNFHIVFSPHNKRKEKRLPVEFGKPCNHHFYLCKMRHMIHDNNAAANG